VDRILYCSGRVHVQGYEIPVPKGNYATTLHFFYGSLDVAAFGIYIEGGLAYTAAGNDTLFVVDVPATTVTDGLLSIGFTNASFSIRISALEVHAAPETAGNKNNATAAPDVSPVVTTNVTYSPGLLLTEMAGLMLSQGLTARLIASSKQRVEYANGSFSSLVFHDKPDAGATYVDTRPFNVGGWIYVSNSEADLNTTFPGGVVYWMDHLRIVVVAGLRGDRGLVVKNARMVESFKSIQPVSDLECKSPWVIRTGEDLNPLPMIFAIVIFHASL
jgi:hypothetical protein